MDGEQIKAVTWEAPEHWHDVKNSDWFWVLGIMSVSIACIAIFFGNALLGIVILLGGFVVGVLAMREAKTVAFAVTQRGIRIDDTIYPYSTLDTFYLDEDHPIGPMLLVKSQKLFMPLMLLPLPEEYVDEVELLISSRLPEEHLEEPFIHKVMEFFGF